MKSSSPDQDPRQKGSDAETEEIEHLDDKVIGRAFRWSAFAVVVVVAAVVGALLYARRKGPAAPVQITQIAAPVVAAKPVAEPPSARFTDITASAGIRFSHNNGAQGEKLLPETM